MSQYWTVITSTQAEKELSVLPHNAQRELRYLFRKLAKDGHLSVPYGNKMDGYSNLFEMRIRSQGQFRALYAYQKSLHLIVVLAVFQKKTEKTPSRIIKTALRRFREE